MARKEKMNVDYFPHYISKGKKMSHIKKKYPRGEGYSIWYIVLEQLAEANHHFLDIRDELQLLFLASECDSEENRFIEVISEIAKIGGFDKELLGSGIIWSESFTESVQEAWRRRSVECFGREEIMEFVGLTKKKVKEKVKSIIEPREDEKVIGNKILDILVDPFGENKILECWKVWKEYKLEEFKFKYKSSRGEQMAMNELHKIAKGSLEVAEQIINQSISNSWKGLFALKNTGNNGGKPTAETDDERFNRESEKRRNRLVERLHEQGFGNVGEIGHSTSSETDDTDFEIVA